VGTSGTICEDENPCTINGCNANTSMCVYSQLEEAGTPCVPPNNKCLQNASCNADGVCTGGEEKDCNDGNPCTNDTCDPETGECIREPLEGECNDDSVCTVNDVCQDGECVGESIVCAALDDCHAPGECDPETGLCDDPRVPAGTECESGTGTCDNRGICVANPTAGAGGAGPEGGATGEGGAPPGVEGGAGGSSPSAGGPSTVGGDAGDGGDEEPERGETFVREPGGCACAVPRRGEPDGPLLMFLASALGLALLRRRRINERRADSSPR
jgi:hypothetical protein